MKSQLKFILLLFSVLLVVVSCDKFTGDTDSISGAWRCNDDIGSSGSRQYSVSIYRAGEGLDSTYFVINNFHNLGYEVDTYVQLIDTVITIRDFNGIGVSGGGFVSKDLKRIVWNYSISGDYIIAYYFKN